MDKELSKAICATLRPVALSKAEEVVKGCGVCDGIGEYDDAPDGSCSEHIIPCPTCTPKRDLMLAWAEKLVLHEWKLTDEYKLDRELDIKDYYWRCTCGRKAHAWDKKCINPRFSIEPIDGHLSLVQFLKDAGEWEGFLRWHSIELVTIINRNPQVRLVFIDIVDAEILTTTALLAQAINSYFTREER